MFKSPLLEHGQRSDPEFSGTNGDVRVNLGPVGITLVRVRSDQCLISGVTARLSSTPVGSSLSEVECVV